MMAGHRKHPCNQVHAIILRTISVNSKQPCGFALLSLTEAEEPKQDDKVIHLAEVTCRTLTELTQQEQGIIMAWLQGYYLPENAPPVIDVEKLLSDRAKLTEHRINEPEDDLMTAAEAVMEK
jgi:hypothetical protein